MKISPLWEVSLAYGMPLAKWKALDSAARLSTGPVFTVTTGTKAFKSLEAVMSWYQRLGMPHAAAQQSVASLSRCTNQHR